MGLFNFKATLSGVVLALTSVVANAAYDYDLPAPGSQLTHEIYGLHVLIMWVCVAIFIVVFGAMVVSIFKHRKSSSMTGAFGEKPSFCGSFQAVPVFEGTDSAAL